MTDRGSEFHNTLMSEMCALMRVRHVATTPYNPRADGAVERMNQEVGNALHFLVGADHARWDDLLAVMRFKINTTPSTVTGYTPFYMMHGREARTPDDATLEAKSVDADADAYMARVADALQDGWGEVRRTQREH